MMIADLPVGLSALREGLPRPPSLQLLGRTRFGVFVAVPLADGIVLGMARVMQQSQQEVVIALGMRGVDAGYRVI